jgi:DNA-binding CsgD family transcriptional regulator
MSQERADRAAIGAGVFAVLAAVWAVLSDVVAPSDAMPAVLVPMLFVLAGVLGPVWGAARFTCRALVCVGALHLLGVATSAVAREAPGAAEWHALSLLLFSAGFVALLPLAAGYPAGPAPRSALWVSAACCVLPIAAAFSGPTPAVLAGSGRTLLLGPIAPVLPDWIGDAASAVFLVPVAAVVVGSVRAVRGDRETRGRLLLPLIALGAFALLLIGGAVLPVPQITTALFLVSAPLVPTGLVLGARPLLKPLDVPRPLLRPDGVLEALSPREREVLAAMADGQTNAVIAQRLHMSLSAVEKHTTAIFTKLGLPPDAATHRRVAAVVAYLRAAAR